MMPLNQRDYISKFLQGNHELRLKDISDGNEDLVAELLAASICYAVNKYSEKNEPTQLGRLCSQALEILQSNRDLTDTERSIPILREAILRYREMVIPGLGGRQTQRIENTDSAPLKSKKSKGNQSLSRQFFKAMCFAFWRYFKSLINRVVSLISRGGL